MTFDGPAAGGQSTLDQIRSVPDTMRNSTALTDRSRLHWWLDLFRTVIVSFGSAPTLYVLASVAAVTARSAAPQTAGPDCWVGPWLGWPPVEAVAVGVPWPPVVAVDVGVAEEDLATKGVCAVFLAVFWAPPPPPPDMHAFAVRASSSTTPRIPARRRQ